MRSTTIVLPIMLVLLSVAADRLAEAAASAPHGRARAARSAPSGEAVVWYVRMPVSAPWCGGPVCTAFAVMLGPPNADVGSRPPLATPCQPSLLGVQPDAQSTTIRAETVRMASADPTFASPVLCTLAP
ncbi:MAG TPA: hypothetical protein VFZ65_10465 [Planctomycetota bacterium]|nr:hypothetical protein [Planctomycetota bacterium]